MYYNTPDDVDAQGLVWEVFRPVSSDTHLSYAPQSGFGVRSINGANVAVIIHTGPYRTAGRTYKRLEQWIGERQLKVCGPAEEVYHTNQRGSDTEPEIEIRLPVCPI